MNLIPWRRKTAEKTEPLASTAPTSLGDLRHEMDRLFDRFVRDPWSDDVWSGLGEGTALSPRVDVAESDRDVVVKMELPGVDPVDVNLSVSGNALVVRGEKKSDKDDRSRDYQYVERRHGSFSRTVSLPASADPDKVDAAFKNGVLTVTITKRPDAKPKTIKVRGA